MRASALSILSLATLCAAAGHEDSAVRRHHHARNAVGRDEHEARNESQQLSKRTEGQFTYYAAGMGACGQMNQASDYIVALNQGMWDGGAHCFKMITITVNGKSTQAQIVDECPGCEYGGLDFSQGLFEYFSSTDAGVLHGSWEYGDGAPATTSEAPPPPTTTSTWQEPSTTWTPTSTWTPETTSTWSSTSEWSSSFSSSSSESSSSSSSSSSAEPTSSSASSTASSSSASASASATSGGTIEQMNLLILQLGGVVAMAAES
ncbi:hypothetical protein K523DRAFT_326431, partial [Schizophyllum commune Tattone D]